MDRSCTKYDWEQMEGKWYHFDLNDWIQTRWIKDKGKRYYLKESGEMVAGEVLMMHSDIYNDEMYVFAENGHMLTQENSRRALV